MTRFVLLLRAINVGSGRKVPMASLRDLLTGLGLHEVRSHIQSGNVVVSAIEIDRERVEAALEAEFGFPIAVIVRTADQVASAMAANPYIPKGADPARIGIVFLAAAPSGDGGMDPDGYPPDRFAIIGREIHLHCPNGFGRSKLSNDFFERRLSVTATTRNWNTTERLLEMARA